MNTKFGGKTIALLVVLVVIVVLLVIQQERPSVKPKENATSLPSSGDVVSYSAILSGTYTDCIPLKDTLSQKQENNENTEKCRIGIHTDEGLYYALDYTIFTGPKVIFARGDRFRAHGLITPVEMISSDQTRTTVGSGIFSIIDSVVILSTSTNPSSSPPSKPNGGKCYIGGCSAQLCSEQPGMASSCEYRETYACYKTASCERQPTGACGWTPTPALSACLAK